MQLDSTFTLPLQKLVFGASQPRLDMALLIAWCCRELQVTAKWEVCLWV